MTTNEVFVILGFVVAVAACIAALLVVPEVRRWLRLDGSSSGDGKNTNPIASGISWPDALNKAVGDFKKLHPDKNLDVEEKNTQGDTATVRVKVYDAKNPFLRITAYDRYRLKINKSGELLEIRQVVKAARHIIRS